jgi:uncharacterized protein (TIGR02284 family)
MEIADTLKALTETARAAELGFRRAAEAAANPDVHALFEGYADQHARFAAELERELHRVVPDAGQLTGIVRALRGGWESLEPAVERADPAAVLPAVARGIAATVRGYEAALDRGLPPEVRLLVEAQLVHVRDARDRVDDLAWRRPAA